MRKVISHINENWIRHGFETLVVIVGILVAYSLNSWNERVKQNESELVLLENLKSDILRNIQEHTNDLANARRSYESSLKILNFIENGVPTEETATPYFATFNLYSPFFITASTFQSLTSGGLDLISNDILRNDIASYYEVNGKRLEFWQTNTAYWPPLILKSYLENNFYSEVSYNIDSLLQIDLKRMDNTITLNQLFDKKERETLQPIDVSYVLNDPKFKIILLSCIKNAASLNRAHLNGIKNLEKILPQIDKEINRLSQ
jgi:cell division protein ZapA (FtsZ GTPase activity inhibitor)